MPFELLVVGGVIVLVVIAAVMMLSKRNRGVTIVPSAPPASSPSPGDSGDEIAALLAGGNKIQAIKLVRERTGLGLKEAKEYVETLERGAPSTPPPVRAPAVVSQELDLAHIQELLAKKYKIEAIKYVRECTGWGLKEAKDYVDQLE